MPKKKKVKKPSTELQWIQTTSSVPENDFGHGFFLGVFITLLIAAVCFTLKSCGENSDRDEVRNNIKKSYRFKTDDEMLNCKLAAEAL